MAIHRKPPPDARRRRPAGAELVTATIICCLLLAAWVRNSRAQEADSATAGAPIQLTGTLSVTWGDPQSRTDVRHAFVLAVEDGQRWDLALTAEQCEAAGGITALSGAQVIVEGRVVAATGRLRLRVEQLRRVETAGEGEDYFGPQPYVWILLRFAGNPSTPQPPSWFETQALGGEPSMDHYWREVSFDNINLQGSAVTPWLDLPREHDYYVYEHDPESPGVEIDDDRLDADVFAVADPIVDFSDFSGYMLCFNDTLDCCSWGGRRLLTLDGETREWGYCLLANWGWGNHEKIAHEMGHSFDLPHSARPDDEVLNPWDIMSLSCGACGGHDPVYGWLGINTISYHKHKLGWIHPSHRYVLPTSPAVTSIWLNDLVVPPPVGRMLMAQSRNDILSYFTVERRRWTGYDVNLFDETVVIHHVVTNRQNPARLIDADPGGIGVGEGARWDLGETFWDEDDDFVVTVVEVDDTGSLITLSNAGLHDVYVDRYNTGTENGTAAHPWNTVYEGNGAVYPQGNVHIVAASYPGGMTFRKPATLQRWGSSGEVVIGQ